MSYVRADEVLPEDLINAIQQYVSGKSIYIPCKEKDGAAGRQHGSIIKREILRFAENMKAEFQ